MKDFSYYRDCFMTLHTAKSKGYYAPHKPLLLLAVIDLVERGVIRTNHIELTDALINAFKANTSKYLGHSTVFKPNIGQPFYHLQHEPFWHLVPTAAENGIAAEPQTAYGKKATSYSISSLRSNYRFAIIDIELYNLLQSEDARAKLRVALISKYLTSQPTTISPLAMVPMCISIFSLIS